MREVISEKEFQNAIARLKELPAHMQSNIKPILKSAAKPILNTARRLAPIQTGYVSDGKWVKHRAGTLKRSLSYIDTRSDRYIIIGVKVQRWGQAKGDFEDGFYAAWVEFGHRARNGTKVEAQPFLRPAFDMHKGSLANNIKKVIADKIARWAKRNAK